MTTNNPYPLDPSVLNRSPVQKPLQQDLLASHPHTIMGTREEPRLIPSRGCRKKTYSESSLGRMRSRELQTGVYLQLSILLKLLILSR